MGLVSTRKVPPAPPTPIDSGRALRVLVDRYLDQVDTLKKPNTYRKYEAVLDRFSDYFKDRQFEDISTDELNDFVVHLKKSGMEANTVLHNVVIIAQFFKRSGRGGIMRQLHLPERTTSLPVAYADDELSRFFAACDEFHRALYSTFLMTGFREQEVMYLFWSDLNLSLRTARVTSKRDLGLRFTVFRQRHPGKRPTRPDKRHGPQRAFDGGKEQETMSTVIIDKPETASEMSVLTDEANTIDGRIRERAFELFEKSGEARGNDSENWFRAEEELLQVPRPTLSARDGSIFLQMTILGYHEEQLKVIAMPDALIVSAEPKHRHSRNHLAAIGAKRIFQRFDLPDTIDTSSVHATFENGLLKIAAKLAAPKRNASHTTS